MLAGVLSVGPGLGKAVSPTSPSRSVENLLPMSPVARPVSILPTASPVPAATAMVVSDLESNPALLNIVAESADALPMASV